MSGPRWVCSGCGGEQTTVLEGRPSIDDRYAVGYCVSCNPMPVNDPKDPKLTKPRNRSTSALVRQDVWDPELLRKRREREAEARLLTQFRNGKLRSDADKDRAAAVIARYAAEARDRRIERVLAASEDSNPAGTPVWDNPPGTFPIPNDDLRDDPEAIQSGNGR